MMLLSDLSEGWGIMSQVKVYPAEFYLYFFVQY